MAKTKNETAGGVATQEPPAPPKTLKNWKFNFRGTWIKSVLVLDGLSDEQAARRRLHELLDQAIIAIETTR